jgi:hypothetical protein
VETRGLADALREAGIAAAPGVCWADELRLGLRGTLRRVWAPRGVKIVQALELRYEWRYLVLAIDGLRGTLQWSWTSSMKALSVASVVEEWLAAGIPGVVWDGAASHRSQAVRTVGLPLVVQPAATPELNPVERIFAAVRRFVEGRTSATLADKMARAERYLTELAAAPARVRSLAGWAWIRDMLQPTENTMSS